MQDLEPALTTVFAVGYGGGIYCRKPILFEVLMKKILFMIYSLVLITVICCLSSCCTVSGFGMKNTQKQRQESSDKFHEKVDMFFDRISR